MNRYAAASKDSFDGLPPLAKNVITIGVVAGVGYGLYKMNKNADKKAKDVLATIETNQAGDTILKSVKSDITAAVKKNPSSVSYTAAQYRAMADMLEQYMGFNPNYQGMFDLFAKMKTKTDVMLLVASFAVRTFQYTPVSDAHNYNFFQWLANINYGNSIRQGINTILKKKGIDYSF